MAATIFEIIGAIAILLGVLITIAILFFLNAGLKSVNRALGARKGDLSRDLRVSLEGLDEAQGQLDAMSAATAGIEAGMRSAIAAVDSLVKALKSGAFQVGVPAVMMVLLVFVAVPRGFMGSRKKKKKRKQVPPPSWGFVPESIETDSVPGSGEKEKARR